MYKPRVGVIRGGPSSEYEISLQTGSAVLNVLDNERYEPVDIVISKEGLWHINGLVHEPHQALRKVDVVFNALHGNYGEDGKLQHLLETHNIPFTGSGSLVSAITMNKVLAKDRLRESGLKVPAHIVVERAPLEEALTNGEDAVAHIYHLAHSKFAPPYVVKPVSGGSSNGVVLVRDSRRFAEALAKAFMHGDTVMIE
ncbi:MAG: hypothetical protein KGJ35_03140, partial [Patescibacteria group bacterium]|nr:hypothetical protein [Patescibacteria group bacterium]